MDLGTFYYRSIRSEKNAGLASNALGTKFINNNIHDIRSNVGVSFWNNGEDKVFYGNTIYRIGYDPYCRDADNGNAFYEPPCVDGDREINPHSIYTQNNYSTNGYMYHVKNIFLDPGNTGSCNSCFIFHGYTESGFVSGFYLFGNVFSEGRFLIGGYNEPHKFNVLDNNFFEDTIVQFGYRRPNQVNFINNKLFKSVLSSGYLWGALENTYVKDIPNNYSNNTFYEPPTDKDTIFIQTSSYYDAGSGQ